MTTLDTPATRSPCVAILAALRAAASERELLRLVRWGRGDDATLAERDPPKPAPGRAA